MSASVQQLIYYSLWRPQNAQDLGEALGEILAVSVRNNVRTDVTGALLCCNGWFLQVLEGAESAVFDVYARIVQDRRHAMVKLVGMRPARQRAFPDWRMCGAHLDPADQSILRVLKQSAAFSPPDMSFATALEVLDVVQQVQTQRNTLKRTGRRGAV